jgi:uncharacterized protein
MSLKEKITEDMKIAMRAQDKDRLAVIRLILAALKQREVDERITLSDEQILSILNKMVKQRQDSIAQFEEGKRFDLAAKEQAEIKVIQTYLPTPLDEQALNQIIQQAIQQSQANSPKDIGKVMALVKSQVQGKADMTIVSMKVKALLGTS